MLQEVLEVTVTELSATPAAVRLMVVGLMDSVASPAACVMVQVSVWPALSVTVNCAVRAVTPELAPMLVNVMLNAYSCVAPGSPVIEAPLVVLTELAVYEAGSVNPMLSVPVSENVNLDELEVPEIVTVPPVFATVAVLSKSTNSVLPAWIMVRVFDSTPEAEKVAVVVRELRPVCVEPVHDTVSLPLPLVLLGVAHDAYAIIRID